MSSRGASQAETSGGRFSFPFSVQSQANETTHNRTEQNGTEQDITEQKTTEGGYGGRENRKGKDGKRECKSVWA